MSTIHEYDPEILNNDKKMIRTPCLRGIIILIIILRDLGAQALFTMLASEQQQDGVHYWQPLYMIMDEGEETGKLT